MQTLIAKILKFKMKKNLKILKFNSVANVNIKSRKLLTVTENKTERLDFAYH